ncbi:anti-sigma regulatory factor [Streptomyces sp. H51]|uniref:anti-sigma regulatory factor n=1 Tax=Streptomyces sp. H51 TaxID=3111770 RepID=UPI002D76F281|nr:anti-sigma regulatory factor [Streptomyces sp. H51]
MTTDATTGREADAFAIAHEADLIRVRKVLRAEADAAGLNLVDATKLITAGSELARNILNYATGGRGRISVEQVFRQGRRGVRATFSDEGPGIADIDAALTDGFSTKGSLGLGLPGARRLVDDMTLTSVPGTGTTVVIVKWQR